MSLIDRVRSSVIRDSEENYYSSTTLPLELIPAVIGHEAQYTPELVATLSQDEHTHTHTFTSMCNLESPINRTPITASDLTVGRFWSIWIEAAMC